MFRIYLPKEDLKAIRFWVGYLVTNAVMATLKDFWVLEFVGVPQPKPIHKFSPNFGRFMTTTVAMATL